MDTRVTNTGDILVTLILGRIAGRIVANSEYNESADKRAPSSNALAESRTLRFDWLTGDGMNAHIWSLKLEETAERSESYGPIRNWDCSKLFISITRELFIVTAESSLMSTLIADWRDCLVS